MTESEAGSDSAHNHHAPPTSVDVDQFCDALDRFGPGETLNLLIENSKNDDVLPWLLRFPSFVAFGEFVHRLPRYNFQKTLFGTILIKTGKQRNKSKAKGRA